MTLLSSQAFPTPIPLFHYSNNICLPSYLSYFHSVMIFWEADIFSPPGGLEAGHSSSEAGPATTYHLHFFFQELFFSVLGRGSGAGRRTGEHATYHNSTSPTYHPLKRREESCLPKPFYVLIISDYLFSQSFIQAIQGFLEQ